jgi:hypothetical protein
MTTMTFFILCLVRRLRVSWAVCKRESAGRWPWGLALRRQRKFAISPGATVDFSNRL